MEKEVIKTFRTPNFTRREFADIVWRRFAGHSKRNKKNVEHICPKKEVFSKNKAINFGFTGDVMPIDKEFKISSELKKFTKNMDYVIINLEGIITKKRRMWAEAHDESIIENIKKEFPKSEIVIYCANNHSGDFGREEFNKSIAILEKHFKVFGTEEKPSIQIGNVNLCAVTFWSNQENSFTFEVSRDEKEAIKKINKQLKKDCFNILLPHWGDEMHLYPNKSQVAMADKLLEKWDSIVGNHPHCPQPVSVKKVKGKDKIVAYSLGDFCFKLNWKLFEKGAIVKLGISTGKSPVLTKVEHENTRYKIKKNQTFVSIEN